MYRLRYGSECIEDRCERAPVSGLNVKTQAQRVEIGEPGDGHPRLYSPNMTHAHAVVTRHQGVYGISTPAADWMVGTTTS